MVGGPGAGATREEARTPCREVVAASPVQYRSPPCTRLVPYGVLLASACGSATDDRPATLDYITETILAPTCATAECHSDFKRQVGDQFDTPAGARRSIVANGLVVYPDDIANPDGAS